MSRFGTVNPELLGLARQRVARFAKLEKQAFIPGGDPAMGGGDPSAGGGAPPEGMPPGGDPSGGAGGMPPGGMPLGGAGGMPPGGMPLGGAGGMPPGGMPLGGAGGMPPGGAGSDPTAGIQAPSSDITSLIQQQVQAAVAGMAPGGGMGAGAGAGGIKPKIDQNVVLLQILKMLAKISDTLGIHIPASEMVVTPEDLRAMAQGGPGAAAAQDQGGGGGAAGGMPGQSAIKPIEPMQAASPGLATGGEKGAADHVRQQGVAFDTSALQRNMNKASAIAKIRGLK